MLASSVGHELHAGLPALRLGTRASALARWQAEYVARQLQALGQPVELVYITTQGDREQQQPLVQGGGEGLFTKELQRCLLRNEIDLAVHSLKDLPTEAIPGLVLGAIPARGPTADLFLSVHYATWQDLPRAAKVGTGSRRRAAQLLGLRPDLQLLEIRGNVDTRINKLTSGHYDAIILAEAGMSRLGLTVPHQIPFAPEQMLPAVGQGALGLEIRADDVQTLNAVARLDDPPTRACVLSERAFLRGLRAGCMAPVGALAQVDSMGAAPTSVPPLLTLTGGVFDLSGTPRLLVNKHGSMSEAETVGSQAAEALLAQGAGSIIAASRGA